MATALAKAKGKLDFPELTRAGWGNRFAMDARSNIESRLPSGGDAAPDGSSHVALHSLAKSDFKFSVRQILKKTPCAAGLKPAGRDVAKDLFNIARMPLPTSAKWNPNRDPGRGATIDADAGTLNVKLTDAEPAKRKTKWMPGATNPTSDVLWWTVGPGVDDAVAHLGAAYEKQCYADI